MPEALSSAQTEPEAAAEMPSAAERAAQLRAWQRRPRSDSDDNRSAAELGDTLGRLRDEYTRSFALAPDPDPPTEPEPEASEAADDARREPEPEPKRAEPAPKPSTEPTPANEARERYGL